MKQMSIQTYPFPVRSLFVATGLIALLVAGSLLETVCAEPLHTLNDSPSTSSLLPNTLLSTSSSLVSPKTTVVTTQTIQSPYHITKPSSLTHDLQGDRIFLVNTRCITSNSCRANLRDPKFRISRLDRCGRGSPSDLNDYLTTMSSDRPRFIYIHGNRRDASNALSQGLWVYREMARRRPNGQAFDWVIWSWPSEAESKFLSDVRMKAERTDCQALYVAWMLSHHHSAGQPTALMGFSFGGRVVTGSMHALAGGVVGRRKLDQPAIVGANIDVGLLAPAVDNTWLSRSGQHRLATKNMNRLVLLYNHRDYVLRFFRLVSRTPGSQALGFAGPRSIAPRYDGTRLPVRSRDCASTVGSHHHEKDYYQNACYAGREMATLIESTMVVN